MADQIVRIFISSPGDVAEERDKARRVIEGLQRQFRGVTLQPVLWEDFALPATASFQETIDYVLITRPIDVAVFILWSRLGTPLGPATIRPDGTAYQSGTEREFDLMLQAFEQSGRKRPVILAYARADKKGFFDALERSEDQWEERIQQLKLAERFIREQFQDEQGHNLRAYHSYTEPVSFAQRLQTHLREVLKELVGQEVQTLWLEAPYRGLEFFDLEHAPIFEGRDEDICDILQRLRDQSRAGCDFVVIVGSSGSGKSSLARAGVAATLVQQGYLDGIHEWRVGVFVPGLAAEGLFQHLARVLVEQIPELAESPAELERVADGLRQAPEVTLELRIDPAFVRASQEAGGAVRLLLVLDQMEELWTTPRFPAADRERFLEVVEHLARSGHVAVVATLRSDFYLHAQMLPVFLRLKGDRGHVDLLPPAAAALQRLIAEPARLAGLTFERDESTGRKLDEVIANEAIRDPASLPLLEYALSELYKLRDEERRLLTFAAYEQLGSVEGALGKRAAETYRKLPEDVQAALPEILPLLVTVDPSGEQPAVRRRAAMSDLTSTPNRQALTDALIRARFLTTDRIGEAAVASLAHEALLRSWTDVSRWIDENAELLRLRESIDQAQVHWNQENRHPSLLLSPGLRLEEGRRLLSAGSHMLSPETDHYITASIAFDAAETARRHRRRRYALAVMSLITVIALIAGGVAWWKQSESAVLANDNEVLAGRMRRSADKAIALAREKSTLAEQMKQLADKANALAADKTRLATEQELLAEKERLAREDVERKAAELEAARAKIEKEFTRAETERLRAEAGRFQIQLARVNFLGSNDPQQATELLLSSEDCPREARDYTWSFLFAQALGFPGTTERTTTLKQASGVNALAYAPQSSLLASGHEDGTISLWDASQKKVATLRQHSGPVLSLDFSPDGRTLVSGGRDARVNLWDAKQRQLRKTLAGHTAAVRCLDVSSDGLMILSVAAGAEPPQPDEPVAIPQLAESGELILWTIDGQRDKFDKRPEGGVRFAAFEPGTNNIIVGGSDGNTFRWNLKSGESERWPVLPKRDGEDDAPIEAPVGWQVDCLAFSVDGRRFCSSASQTGAEQPKSRLIAQAAPTFAEPPPLPTPPDEPAPADAPPPIPLEPPVDFDSGPIGPPRNAAQLSATTFGHARRIVSMAFSTDGRTLATGDAAGQIQLRDPITCGVRLALRVHQGPVTSLAFSADGLALASGSNSESSTILIQRGLPSEIRAVADKVGWWIYCRNLTEEAVQLGRMFGTPDRSDLSAMSLAASEAELAWCTGRLKDAVRHAADASKHADQYADRCNAKLQMGLLALPECAAAAELRVRMRLAYERTRQASGRAVPHASKLHLSRLPILRELTGGVAAGAVDPAELQMISARADAFKDTYLIQRARYLHGLGDSSFCYLAAARWNRASAAVAWGKGDSAAALKALSSAADFHRCASESRNSLPYIATITRHDPAEAIDLDEAVAVFKRSLAGGELLPVLADVTDRAEIEVTGRPGLEELRILEQAVQLLQALNDFSQARLERGLSSKLEHELLACRLCTAKADRAWAAGEKAACEQHLAEAETHAAAAGEAAQAFYEAGHMRRDQMDDVMCRVFDIRLQHRRVQRSLR